nr:pentatricopeptide repeat-containing protein, mitochondrial [Quercus suber]
MTLRLIGEKGSHVFNQNLKITQLGKSGRIKEAVKLFSLMKLKNTVSYNSMISAYMKNGRLGEARRLFDEMPHPNLVSWNSVIAGYLHNDKVEEASQLFDKMPKRDRFSWSLMITYFSRNGELEKARKLFDLLTDKRDSSIRDMQNIKGLNCTNQKPREEREKEKRVEGGRRLIIKTLPRHCHAHPPLDNYALALHMALMFFNAQRCSITGFGTKNFLFYTLDLTMWHSGLRPIFILFPLNTKPYLKSLPSTRISR